MSELESGIPDQYGQSGRHMPAFVKSPPSLEKYFGTSHIRVVLKPGTVEFRNTKTRNTSKMLESYPFPPPPEKEERGDISGLRASGNLIIMQIR